MLLSLVGVVTISFAQEKRPAEKLLELSKLTRSIAKEKLVPIWEAHKCDDPEIFYFVIYADRDEFKRQMEITAESIGDRCHWVGFRILYIKADRRQPERATILWRGFPDGEKPPI
jgi:hypothetical protein